MRTQLIVCCILVNLCVESYAQTPERKATALIHKITATWCTPCGTWGWTLADALREQSTGKALYLGLFASGSAANRNAEFYNETAATLAGNFTFSGYPSFGINGLPYSEPSETGGIDADQVKLAILSAMDSLTTGDPLASAAGYYSMDADTITVHAKIRFWEATEGEFYLAAYIVEDNAMNLQSGRSLTGGEVAHHDVLRASMTAESAWGILVDTGQLHESAEYSRDFSYTLTDPKLERANLKVYLILWKKEGERYRFINASLAEDDPLAIPASQSDSPAIELFPNPAQHTLQLTLRSKESSHTTLRVMNAAGTTVIGAVTWPVAAGENQRTLDVSGLSAGPYILYVKPANGPAESIKFVVY